MHKAELFQSITTAPPRYDTIRRHRRSSQFSVLVVDKGPFSPRRLCPSLALLIMFQEHHRHQRGNKDTGCIKFLFPIIKRYNNECPDKHLGTPRYLRCQPLPPPGTIYAAEQYSDPSMWDDNWWRFDTALRSERIKVLLFLFTPPELPYLFNLPNVWMDAEKC